MTPPSGDIGAVQAELDRLAGHYGLADWARFTRVAQRELPALLAELRAARKLADAAIALAWSESGTDCMLRGDPDWEVLYDPWEEMNALVASIDAIRPGWREEGEPDA